MTKKYVIRIVLAVISLLTLFSLFACTADMDIGQNTELSRRFMDCVLDNDYDTAYIMVQETVTNPDFHAYWVGIQSAVEGATSYEMEQIGWHINKSNGLTTRTTAYQVYTDTDRIILLRTVTRNDIKGLAGIHFSDVTDFIHATDSYIPTVRIVLWVVSGILIAFTIWMLVDCLRRNMKYKVLWAILIFFGLALTVTMGETSNISFKIGLFFMPATMDADPALLSVVTTLTVPLGAILYLCLRKRFTIAPPAQEDRNEPSIPSAEGVDSDEAEPFHM
jgi:hypothetical protein